MVTVDSGSTAGAVSEADGVGAASVELGACVGPVGDAEHPVTSAAMTIDPSKSCPSL
ncbi:MAG TPA: hypothetical protein VIP54_00830 [Microterricola sp.]